MAPSVGRRRARQCGLQAVALTLLCVACASPSGSGSRGAGPDATPAASATPAPTAGTPSAQCSAEQAAGADSSQPALPEAVARTRQRILAAARACDYDELAQVAPAGDGFTFSFGDGSDPGRFWREQEQQGEQPMRYLVGLLNLPHSYVEEHDHYIWPEAFGYDSWQDVPEQAREDLRELYTERELAGFESFGSYVGYRIGIASDGRWEFFVAGD